MYNKHLDAFLMAADCGSFTKAAEKLFISPNALIKQIPSTCWSKLELTLFAHQSRHCADRSGQEHLPRCPPHHTDFEMYGNRPHPWGRKTARDTARQLAHVSCPPHRQSMAGRQRGASAHQAANCANGRQQK